MQMKEVTIAAGHGPGKTLGQARADLKLSQDEVALQLHLAPRQIIALESDDYDNLPEPTYVRGYLRNYALLVGLNPDPILESYARLLPARKAPAVQRVSVSVDEDVSSKEPHIKFASYVVAALVIGLVIAWWQSYEPAGTIQDESTAALPAGGEALLATGEAGEAGEAGQGALSEAMPKTEPLPASPLAARAPASGLPVTPALRPAPIPTVSPASRGATPAVPARADPVSSTPATVAAPAPAQPITSTPTVSAPASVDGPAVSDGRAQIVLRTEQESWAEVRDGQDTRLLYESVPAGRTVKIEGEAPLSVFLGNADGVKVEYNGRPYDTSRHKRGLVARFTLGAKAPAPDTDAAAP